MTDHSKEVRDIDVAIIGAGPIMLTAGCALRHHGVEMRVVEPRTEPEPDWRAENLRAWPQEQLESVGLRLPITRQANEVRASPCSSTARRSTGPRWRPSRALPRRPSMRPGRDRAQARRRARSA